MRKCIILLSLCAGLLACNGVDKYREPIEDLVGQWETSTQAVQAFASNLQTERSAAQDILSGMSAPDSLGLVPETMTQIGELRTTTQTEITKLSGLQQTVDAFVTEWTTKATIVENLKKSLGSGEFEGDIPATLSNLKGMLDSSAANLGEWTGQLNDSKTLIAKSYQTYQSLLKPIQ